MKLTNSDKLCKFYVTGGLCSHLDAPKPRHSRCIGEFACGVYDVDNYTMALILLEIAKCLKAQAYPGTMSSTLKEERNERQLRCY